MKKSFKLIKVVALACATLLVSGCSLLGGGSNNNNNNNNTNLNDNQTTKITLNYTTLSLEYGDRQTLTATVEPEGSVTWSSNNSKVATVSTDGVVEAVGGGTCTITAKTSDGKTAKCTVTVTDNRPPVVNASSISVNKSDVTIELGETEQLTATILPDDTTDKSITWTSSKASVASVDSNGLVSTYKTGTATITAKTANGKTSKCNVTVVDTPVVNNEKFTKEKIYIFSGSFSFLLSEPVQYDIRYTFKVDGSATVQDKVKNTTVNGTYKISDGMIYIYNTDGSLSERYFNYDNIIMLADDIPVILVRDGSAVSQKGTGTIGYFAIINVNVATH